MKFTKMHCIGNDYIVVNCFEEKPDFDESRLAELLCDRHFGIGADGLLFIQPSEIADYKMSMFNADGTRTEMSGNGIICLSKYVYDNRMTNMTSVTIETLDGVKRSDLTVKDEKMRIATFAAGTPVLRSNGIELPIDSGIKNYDRDLIVEVLTVGKQEVRIVFLNVGVPHTVIFANDLQNVPFGTLGPAIENHPRFPEKTNVNFVQVADRTHLRVRSWSRGVGDTMANGTGAAAAAVASWLLGFADREVDVKLPGGTVRAEIAEDGRTFVSGPATEVFRGEIDI